MIKYSSMKKVCLVIGAGAGIGGNCAKVFARNGYYSFMLRRTDQEGLDKIASDISIRRCLIFSLHLLQSVLWNAKALAEYVSQ